jgi:hypothetical protein
MTTLARLETVDRRTTKDEAGDMREEGWDKHAVQRRKIHEGYILLILLSVLIGLLTVKWSDVPKLTEYLGFALTLASLLLAVMAIGYAIYSNQGLETNLASLVSSITDVREIASTLSASSKALSTDLQSLSQTTGGIDKRVTEIAEYSRLQDQKKQAVVETGPTKPVSTGINLEHFARATSTNGKHVLFTLTIAFLNKRAINMREYFQQTGMAVDYNYGFLVALATADIYEGSADFDGVTVNRFEGADEKFLSLLIEGIIEASVDEKRPRMKELTLADLGRARAYLEERGLRHFGTLDSFEKEPLKVVKG